VYSGIEQNTEPPLATSTASVSLEFYPFLPYQPPLFLEILSNLRQEAHDPAKSIFSGTARAILALVHGLLQEWIEAGEETNVISLVDFYDLIEPELDDITPQDVGLSRRSRNSTRQANWRRSTWVSRRLCCSSSTSRTRFRCPSGISQLPC